MTLESKSSRLLSNLTSNDLSQADRNEQNLHMALKTFEPQWSSYGATHGVAHLLRQLHFTDAAIKTKAMIHMHPEILQAMMTGLNCQEEMPVQWILTLLYDVLREDASCVDVLEKAMQKQIKLYEPLMDLFRKSSLYNRDKVSWILSTLIGHCPRSFTEQQVGAFLREILDVSEPAGSDLSVGTLEVIVNLLKTPEFRPIVWSHQAVTEHIFMVSAKSQQSHSLYRSVFAMWLMSFDPAVAQDMKKYGVVARIKEILAVNRVEKVVRICLTVVKNCLTNKARCEEMVDCNILEVVQNLEYEKWRDAELYDEIRELCQAISNEVQEVSNFDRYERDLASGKLTWGFTHTSKFFGENIMKFDHNDFRAAKQLAAIVLNGDSDFTTLAVACHDIGEFVALHPLGKKKMSQLGVKEHMMSLMINETEEFREVRREALLCCQKIMLNKWQEVDKAQTK